MNGGRTPFLLITGGSRGIGGGTAPQVAEEAARFAIGFDAVGLRPARNPDGIPLCSDMTVYRVHRLPVAW